MAASGMYCTVQDVMLAYPVGLGPSSRPNVGASGAMCGQVGSIIAGVSAELEAAAGYAGYVVPVATTATQALAQMWEYTLKGVLWRCLRITYPNIGGPADHAQGISEYRDAYNTALTEIRKGELPLIGAATDTTDAERLLPRANSTSKPFGFADALTVDSRTTFDRVNENPEYGPAVRRGWQP